MTEKIEKGNVQFDHSLFSGNAESTSQLPSVWRGKDFDKYFRFTIPEQNSFSRLNDMIKRRIDEPFVEKSEDVD